MWWARAIEATKNCQFIILPAMAIFHILLFSFLFFFFPSHHLETSLRLSHMHARRRKILKGEGNRFQYTKWTVTNCQTSHKFVNISFLFISRCLHSCLNLESSLIFLRVPFYYNLGSQMCWAFENRAEVCLNKFNFFFFVLF